MEVSPISSYVHSLGDLERQKWMAFKNEVILSNKMALMAIVMVKDI